MHLRLGTSVGYIQECLLHCTPNGSNKGGGDEDKRGSEESF